ncbi:MAG: three-Cys-motif partner protein TcmP [Deltaproteobacteria bacterium]|nr:three-Cys-motif partner protein TcmP [Deltaproteobacteria bacterium]
MTRNQALKFDEIGYWTEIKLDIIRDYAAAYSKILNGRFHHVYIDAFSGAGKHIKKNTNEWVLGIPLNALLIKPPFKEFHFIDLDSAKADHLKKLIGERPDVKAHQGDCNRILLEKVFPLVQYKDYRRGLCLLDPYGLHLDWDVMAAAGKMKSIEIFLNFPVADMNRNVLWRNPDGVAPADIQRMNGFWGDDSWRKIAYTKDSNLYGWEEKTDNESIAKGFRERLKKIGGFAYVPEPLPMRNNTGAIVYYLFFASPNATANRIVTHIFTKYRNKGIR